MPKRKSEEPHGGSGRGAGRKKAAPVLGGGQNDLRGQEIPARTQVSLAELLGARASPAARTRPAEPGAGAGAGAGAGVAGAGDASAGAAPATTPAQEAGFKDTEELGTRWHSLIGFGAAELVEANVEKTLKDEAIFLQRVLVSDEWRSQSARISHVACCWAGGARGQGS